MRLVRTILALAISVALALLPVGAAAAFSAANHNADAVTMQMSASSDMSMEDCCPGQMKTVPCHGDGYKCSMGLCCAGVCASLGELAAVHFAVMSETGNTLPIPADQVVSLRGSSPPFRPPRV